MAAETMPDTLEMPVTSIEVVGVRNVSIVYRDRDGQILFRTDPLSNVTIVSKGALPVLTIRNSHNAKTVPIVSDRAPIPQLRQTPDGCELSVGTLAERQPTGVPVRCIAGRQDSLRSVADLSLAH